MHQPELNPAGQRIVGRRVTDTSAVRKVRLTANEDRQLAEIQDTLKGEELGDVVTVSLALRRAVSVYHGVLQQLDPHALRTECALVRHHSTLSSPAKRIIRDC